MQESSPFNDLIGLEFTDWSDGYAAAQVDVLPHHLNRSGALHGGVICTLLDSVCSRSGCWSGTDRKIRSSTISLTVNFSRACKAGLIKATGTVKRGAGANIYSAIGEVRDAEGRLIALAQGTFKYRPGHGPEDAG